MKTKTVFVVHGIGVDSTPWVEGVYTTRDLAIDALLATATDLADKPFVASERPDAVYYVKDGDDCELWVTETELKGGKR